MTQPQYGYPPQQGGYPDPNASQYGAPQGYQPAPAPYGPPPQQYPPQGYQQAGPGGYVVPGQPGYGQPPAPQGPPLPKGSLEDFYNQRSKGSGKGLSWKDKPNGYTYVSVVTRTPGNNDVFVDTHPASAGAQAGQPKTNRDGSFQYVLPVQLRLAWMDQWQQITYPDTEAQAFLRGGLRDELTRAMAEVGQEGVPQEGALIIWTLTHRKPGNNIATNVYAVTYRPAGTWEADPQFSGYAAQLLGGQTPQPAQAPVQGVQGYGAPQPPQAPYQQAQPTQQYAAPAQATPNPQQYGAPQYGQGAYNPNGQPQTAPQYGQAPAGAASAGDQAAYPNPQAQQGFQAAVSGPAQQYPQATPQGAEHAAPQGYAPQPAPAPNPQQPVQQPVQQQLPLQVPQNGVQPSGLDPAKQALLARVTGGQQAGNPQQPQG